jgi:hypothetical protein
MARAFERERDLERAHDDPGAVFPSPEALAAEPSLELGEKIALLRQWAYDARELEVAEEEGMGGGEASLGDRILVALHALEDQAGEARTAAPTKQAP